MSLALATSPELLMNLVASEARARMEPPMHQLTPLPLDGLVQPMKKAR